MKTFLSFSSRTLNVFSGNLELFPSLPELLLIPPTNMAVKSTPLVIAPEKREPWPLAVELPLAEPFESEGPASSVIGGSTGLGRRT